MTIASGSYALITGSSSGIGKAIAEELASRRINILVVALPQTGVMSVAESLRARYPVQAEGFEIDLTHAEAPSQIHRWCRDNGYRVSILVNNAGFGNLSPFDRTEASLFHEMMVLNNHALVLLTHRMIPDLKRNPSAYILNVGSLASFMPVPNKSVYAATKSFVYAFSAILRLELSRYNISVSCLCPGGTRTSGQVMAHARAVSGSRYFIQEPDEVARKAIAGLFKRKFRIIPGWHNKVLYLLPRLLPQVCVHWLLTQLFDRRRIPGRTASLSPTRSRD